MILFYNLFEISEENNMKHLVFTYGTLMKGQAAYQRFGESEFVGDATLYDYAIYEVGEYPAAVPLKDFKERHFNDVPFCYSFFFLVLLAKMR